MVNQPLYRALFPYFLGEVVWRWRGGERVPLDSHDTLKFYQTREHHFNVSRAKKSFCLLTGGAHPPTTYTQKTNRPLHHSNKPNQNCPSLKIGRNTNIKRNNLGHFKAEIKSQVFCWLKLSWILPAWFCPILSAPWTMKPPSSARAVPASVAWRVRRYPPRLLRHGILRIIPAPRASKYGKKGRKG